MTILPKIITKLLIGIFTIPVMISSAMIGGVFAGDIQSVQSAKAQANKDNGQDSIAQNWMVSAANPLAVSAGAKILAQGGTAADAMVAVQSVLGLVEPQSSGLGGGAFLVWYDASTKTITSLDGREAAPKAATPSLFLDDDGQPLKFFDAVIGGKSVGVPATPNLMKTAHDKWGKRDWAGLFDDAIMIADDGFEVSPRLAYLIDRDQKRLMRFKATADYFMPNGNPLTQGDMLKNPAYAETLRGLANQGIASFYQGRIADDIIATIQDGAGNPGVMTKADLADYQVKERPPVCVKYRGHEVCGMGPPSSGGLTVGQILGMVQHHDLPAMSPSSPEAWRLIGDASRLAFADRGLYMADADFVSVPSDGLINPSYLARRAKTLSGPNALKEATAGTPPGFLAYAEDESLELPSTSHISIIDQYGNGLSMTTTIENAFGSRLMTQGGFLLNNELTDFSFRPEKDGKPIANRVEGGKRPRSSMAPTIITKDGSLKYITGSPGGSRIIGYVATSIIAMIDWDMTPQQAAAMPHLINRFGAYELEPSAEDLAPALKKMGYEVKPRSLNSGLHIIMVRDGVIYGGADPRREGIAIGQ